MGREEVAGGGASWAAATKDVIGIRNDSRGSGLETPKRITFFLG